MTRFRFGDKVSANTKKNSFDKAIFVGLIDEKCGAYCLVIMPNCHVANTLETKDLKKGWRKA